MSSNADAPPSPLAPPPPDTITIAITPTSASLLLGATQEFAATVTHTLDTGIIWSVNNVIGGSAPNGFISVTGVYTAPLDLPSPASVQVTAASHAKPGVKASAVVTLVSDITLSTTPATAAVELGASRLFSATINKTGNPDTSVQWSLSGASCPTGCGAVDATGDYTAPQILPSQPNVTLTAHSVADPSKSAASAILITSNFQLQLSAPSNVAAGSVSNVIATLTPVPGSNPSTALTWTLSGAGCGGAACGTLVVATTQSSGGVSSTSATYTAPAIAPTPNTITIGLTPVADPSKAVQAIITVGAVQGGISVTVSPGTATRAINHRISLTAQVNGASDQSVTWSVKGIAGGNITVGQICAQGSSPCQPVTGNAAGAVDYLAPGAVPSPNPVSIQAVSAADTSKSGSAQITVINHVVVSVFPGNVTLAPLAVQGFNATVLGADNQSVVWQTQGTACSVVPACGLITQAGVYTAPAAAPQPDQLLAMATSVDDPAQSGFANIVISSGANILALHPASVYTGAADGFTLRVNGSGFVSTTPGPGAVLFIAGTARTTTCSSADECVAPVTASDVSQTGSVSVQVENPDGSRSNGVSLIVAAPNNSDEIIPLSASQPAATGKDIVMVEPTTAGISVPGHDVDLDVAALGVFSAVNNSCTLGGNPIAVARPMSGIVTADMCIFAQSGLDSSMTFIFAGPQDVLVIAKQPVGLGIIRLTLQIPATAAPGARTLFIQNSNLDKTAASGAIWLN